MNMEEIKEKVKTTRILAAVGLCALFLGTLFPYFKITFLGISGSVKLIDYWEGKVIIVLIIANLLFIFGDLVEKYVPQLFETNVGKTIKKLDSKFSIIPVILVAVMAIYLASEVDVSSKYLKYGLGFYTLWAGVICTVAHAFLYKKTAKKVEAPTVAAPVVNTAAVETVAPVQTVAEPQPVASVTNEVPVETVVTPVVTEEAKVEQPTVKYCTNCGHACDINSNNCMMCGTKLN